MRGDAFIDSRTLTYVVFDEVTRDAVVLDPVLDYEAVGSYTYTESVDRVTDFVRREIRRAPSPNERPELS